MKMKMNNSELVLCLLIGFVLIFNYFFRLLHIKELIEKIGKENNKK